jgi:hypothetical protein
MTGIEAARAWLADLAATTTDPNTTIPAWTCPGCRQIVCIPLGATTLDDVIGMADHRCPTACPSEP